MKAEEGQNILAIQDKEGEFLYVHKIHPEDGWSLCDMITANEDRLQLFFPKTKAANLTPDLSRRFAKEKSQQFEEKDEFLFTVKPEKSRKIIGLIYIKELDWKKKQGEFAYCIDYNYEGRGIASKIVNELSVHAFENLGLSTLQIIVHKANIASIKVAEKCNFTWVKTLVKSYTPIGRKPMDMELYELYRSEKVKKF